MSVGDMTRLSLSLRILLANCMRGLELLGRLEISTVVSSADHDSFLEILADPN